MLGKINVNQNKALGLKASILRQYLLLLAFDTSPVMPDATVVRIPLGKIYVARHLFQNRQEDFSSESVNKIVGAVEKGSFKWEVFDPITVWDHDGKYYILSGHSRTEAFRRLVKMGYDQFASVPAKIFQGTQQEAVDIALNSNTLSTKETITERAAYYRKQRLSGRPAKDVDAEAREREGKNASVVLAVSWLSPKGKALNALVATEGAEVTGAQNVLTIAGWLGESRRRFPELTDSHENELYDWLTGGVYGTRSGQISNRPDFLTRVQSLILKNTVFGAFEQDKPLNPLNRAIKSPVEQEYEDKLREARQNLDNVRQKRKEKLAEFTGRLTDNAKILTALEPYDRAIRIAEIELQRIISRADQVRQATRDQFSLFGIDPDWYGVDFIPANELELSGLGKVADADTYSIIIAKVIGIIESEGNLVWRKPWSAEKKYSNLPPATRHYNLSSKRAYSGINIFLLALYNYVRRSNNYLWLTYKQAEQLGGQVRKGAHGAQIVFYTNDIYRHRISRKTISAKTWEELTAGQQAEYEPSWTLRSHTVFSIEDIDGLEKVLGEQIKPQVRNNAEQIESCEAIVAGMPNAPQIAQDGEGRAFYRPATDSVHMPLMVHFNREQEYYSTLFHELIHSTGHQSRLNREGITSGDGFGNKKYAMEELIAEMGACLLCGESGILYFTLNNSAAYLKGWLDSLIRIMKEDKRFLFQAAAAAQKAADYILHRTETPRLESSAEEKPAGNSPEAENNLLISQLGLRAKALRLSLELLSL